jgi:hypothetical protein
MNSRAEAQRRGEAEVGEVDQISTDENAGNGTEDEKGREGVFDRINRMYRMKSGEWNRR